MEMGGYSQIDNSFKGRFIKIWMGMTGITNKKHISIR